MDIGRGIGLLDRIGPNWERRHDWCVHTTRLGILHVNGLVFGDRVPHASDGLQDGVDIRSSFFFCMSGGREIAEK
jgi:hypothetical protein